MHVIGSLSRLAAALASFIIRVKYTFQPSMPKFDFQHSTMKPVNYQNRTNLVLGWFQKRFSFFGRCRNFILFF